MLIHTLFFRFFYTFCFLFHFILIYDLRGVWCFLIGCYKAVWHAQALYLSILAAKDFQVFLMDMGPAQEPSVRGEALNSAMKISEVVKIDAHHLKQG